MSELREDETKHWLRQTAYFEEKLTAAEAQIKHLNDKLAQVEKKSAWIGDQRAVKLYKERAEKAEAANREQKAEIERLKVELAKTGTGDYKGDFYLGRKTLSGYLRDAEDDRDGWKRLYDAEKAELASLRASVGEKPEDAYKRGQEDMMKRVILSSFYGSYPPVPYVAPTLPGEEK